MIARLGSSRLRAIPEYEHFLYVADIMAVVLGRGLRDGVSDGLEGLCWFPFVDASSFTLRLERTLISGVTCLVVWVATNGLISNGRSPSSGR